jgi:hypothetical protein
VSISVSAERARPFVTGGFDRCVRLAVLLQLFDCVSPKLVSNDSETNRQRSERRSLLKKSLTEPTLLEMSGKCCQLRRSTQNFVEIYSQEFGILKFFWDADSSAARPGRAALASSQTGQCLAGETAITSRSTESLILIQGRAKAMKKSTDEMTRYCLPSTP